MANDYFTNVRDLLPGTVAKGGDVDDKFDAVTSGLDKLPAPRADAKVGFDESINIPEPTDASHAVTKNWAETAMTSQVSQAATSASEAASSAAAALVSENNAAASAEQARTYAEDVLVYQGDHDASAGAPTPLTTGDVYKITVPGTFDSETYTAGDLTLYNGVTWTRIPIYTAGAIRFFGG